MFAPKNIVSPFKRTFAGIFKVPVKLKLLNEASAILSSFIPLAVGGIVTSDLFAPA